MVETNTSPTSQEIETAAEIVSRVESPIPTVLFTEMARLVNTPLIELLPFQVIDDELYVRMIPRPADDIVWKGQIHVPGSAFRAQEDIEQVLQRLFQGELEQKAVNGEIKHLGIHFHDSERGTELAFTCYYVEQVDDEINMGELYLVRDLPENVVASQLPMIYRAADEVIAENELEPLDSSLPRAEIFTFEEHLVRLLASFADEE